MNVLLVKDIAEKAITNPVLCNGQASEYQLSFWFGKNATGITKEQIAARQAVEVAIELEKLLSKL